MPHGTNCCSGSSKLCSVSEADKDTLLEFPASFPVKVMGRNGAEFRPAIVDIIAGHAEFHRDDDVREQLSANGNFVSVTVTFTATSKEQIDTIYQALTSHELVLMVF